MSYPSGETCADYVVPCMSPRFNRILYGHFESDIESPRVGSESSTSVNVEYGSKKTDQQTRMPCPMRQRQLIRYQTPEKNTDSEAVPETHNENHEFWLNIREKQSASILHYAQEPFRMSMRCHKEHGCLRYPMSYQSMDHCSTYRRKATSLK